MSKIQQAVIFGFIIILVVSIGWFIKPSFQFSARGVFLPAKHAIEFSTANRVDMMASLPSNYTRLGEVSVQMHFTNHITPKIVQAAQAKAKIIAAQVGANGLYVQESGYTRPGTTNSNLLVFVLKAQAIKYKQSALHSRSDTTGVSIY